MLTRRTPLALTLAALALLGSSAAAVTTPGAGHAGGDIREHLSGFEEDPLTVSTPGHGTFRARVSEDEIRYRLQYADTEGVVTQAHIHFGGKAQSGGVSVFLCTNLGNGPAGTQACPPGPATVTGTLAAADVIGPVGQGIAAGELGELLAAIAADTTYVNVHTDRYPGGEIRTQIDSHHH